VPAQSFHHGNLRAVLLDHAEQTLRDEGIDALSLRELARQAGVSHGAPRNHFADRQALLDALAERGFDRLIEIVRAKIKDGDDYRAVFQKVAVAYVKFAVSDAALMELMFSAKTTDPPEGVRKAAERLFATFDELIERGREAGWFQETDSYRLKLLFAATMQGTATLLAAGRITRKQATSLVADATSLILQSHGGGPHQ
jgi:AcrR family transcriptional regulator